MENDEVDLHREGESDMDALVRMSRELSAESAELERERHRLVACGVAALSDQADHIAFGHPYHSASLEDVRTLKKELAATRAKLEALREAERTTLGVLHAASTTLVASMSDSNENKKKRSWPVGTLIRVRGVPGTVPTLSEPREDVNGNWFVYCRYPGGADMWPKLEECEVADG
jgi:hypothetical protein